MAKVAGAQWRELCILQIWEIWENALVENHFCGKWLLCKVAMAGNGFGKKCVWWKIVLVPVAKMKVRICNYWLVLIDSEQKKKTQIIRGMMLTCEDTHRELVAGLLWYLATPPNIISKTWICGSTMGHRRLIAPLLKMGEIIFISLLLLMINWLMIDND